MGAPRPNSWQNGNVVIDRKPVPPLCGDVFQRSLHFAIKLLAGRHILPPLQNRPLEGAIQRVGDPRFREGMNEGRHHLGFAETRAHPLAQPVYY